jgi:hypothetical protein
VPKVIRIERIAPRPGGAEEPVRTSRGYQLADPRHGSQRHHAENAVFARDLDEAAEMIERGFSIWIRGAGKRASLISPKALRIVRAS